MPDSLAIDTRPLAAVEAFETFMGRRYDPSEPGGLWPPGPPRETP